MNSLENRIYSSLLSVNNTYPYAIREDHSKGIDMLKKEFNYHPMYHR